MNKIAVLTAMSALLLTACATTEVGTAGSSLTGLALGSIANPVKADMPPGQREYLSRLRCSDGNAPEFHRIGSMGLGSDRHVIDGYEVTCKGSESVVIHMDMYHPGHRETKAVTGFDIT